MKIIEKYQDKIKGVLHGFDRIIFNGHIRQFFSLSGRKHFVSMENILLKNYRDYAMKITGNIIDHAKKMAEDIGRPYIYLTTPKISKEEQAQKVMKESPVEEGLWKFF